MTDPTDSFCERCGTRYAFVPDAPKGPSLKGARLLAKGLKNFVLTDGQSLSDALESARNDDGRDASTRITEAFHRTFNFCMQCRQYACESCWNGEAGACLTCAPMADSSLNLMPVSLTLRGVAEPPQAAAEWSLFTDSPGAGSQQDSEPFWAARPAPQAPVASSRPEPLLPEPAFSEWAVEPKREPTTALPEWPAADLQEVAAAAAAGSNGNAQPRQVDPDAASVWPITDPIAPEMALTPGELAIIKVQLAEVVPTEQVPAAAAQALAEPQLPAEPPATDQAPAQAEPQIAEPPLLAHTATWWNRQPVDDNTANEVGWSLDKPWAHDDEDASLPEPEPAPVAAELVAAGATVTLDTDQELAAASIADDQTPTTHLLPRTLSAPALPPLASVVPAPAAQENGGLVARLFGRRAADVAAAESSARTPGNDRPSSDPWPHATRWSERPAESRRWWLETETPRAETWNSETPIQDVAPEYIEAPSHAAALQAAQSVAAAHSEPAEALTANHANIDPRSAAALRLSAVESAGSYRAPADELPDVFATTVPAEPEPVPAATQPADIRFDRPIEEPARRHPAHEPAWIRTQREATEAASTRTPRHVELVSASAAAARPAAAMPAVPAAPTGSLDAQFAAPQAVPAAVQPAAPEIPPTPPATAWPPLGASWSGREDPAAPWAVPESTVTPAAVAATQHPAPTIAEMWVQSSQEVMNRGSVRVCGSCSLPVSTQARFCRRCGTPQG